MVHPLQQLDSIHAMLNAGQRNLRMERHSLLLWGIPAGILFALSEHILTPSLLPDLQQRALAWLALIGLTLLAVGITDWRWTRSIKQVRDETWSFIHRQVLKVLWLLMALATLTTFAMFFYGGGYMVCAVWLIFSGIGLYVHGLFSEELLEWGGGLMVLLGIACLLAGLPYESMRWISASVFGLGLPLFALMLDRGEHRSAQYRLLQMLGWLALVVVLPLALEQWTHQQQIPDSPVLSLEAFRNARPQQGEQIVHLPAGTPIPVSFELGGDLFGNTDETPVLSLTLRQPVELLLRDGQLTGDARHPGEGWLPSRKVRWISIPWVRAELSPEQGPQVRTSLIVQMRPQ